LNPKGLSAEPDEPPRLPCRCRRRPPLPATTAAAGDNDDDDDRNGESGTTARTVLPLDPLNLDPISPHQPKVFSPEYVIYKKESSSFCSS
jgi:hypothetical protein